MDSCSHGRETDRQKSANGQTDRQTAFQLYIVDTRKNNKVGLFTLIIAILLVMSADS